MKADYRHLFLCAWSAEKCICCRVPTHTDTHISLPMGEKTTWFHRGFYLQFRITVNLTLVSLMPFRLSYRLLRQCCFFRFRFVEGLKRWCILLSLPRMYPLLVCSMGWEHSLWNSDLWDLSWLSDVQFAHCHGNTSFWCSKPLTQDKI